MPAKTPMTAEERTERVGKLAAWARDYIRTLEGLTRTLGAALQAAQSQGAADLYVAREISGARDSLAASSGRPENPPRLDLDSDAAGVAWRALDCMGNASLSERDDAIISYVSGYFGAQLPPRPAETTPAPLPPSVQLPAGIRLAPDGDHVTDAVYPRQIHVWHGPHSAVDGAEALIVESGNVPLLIRPVARNEIVITRG